jgi:hypothetical protein
MWLRWVGWQYPTAYAQPKDNASSGGMPNASYKKRVELSVEMRGLYGEPAKSDPYGAVLDSVARHIQTGRGIAFFRIPQSK